HLTISDDLNLLVLSTCHSYSNAVTTRLNLKSYYDIDEARRIIIMDNDLTDLNIEWIKTFCKNIPFSIIHNTYQLQKGKMFRLAPNKETDVQGIVRALKTDFSELRIKEYHGKSDLKEKAHDFSNVEESWKDLDLIAYISTLKIGVSCTNPKFEWAFCLFNSFIETNAGMNQMLFRMRCIKDYICHIEQRSFNIPIIEKGLFQWLLNAKRECLPRELQNRGIFPDIDSIIQNKDVPTIRLWVAFMLEKFRFQRLFGWRMVDFLKEAGMRISIIEPIPKSEENVVLLSQVMKANSSIVKVEEISDVSNATIVDHETAEFLENKSRKTLEEMRSLDWHHIVECYEISPKLLTENFISKYGGYNHMRWFRAYR
ncbi:19154_t:CDS:2, partial [Funneliformis geosporum]